MDAFDPLYEWLGIPAKDQPPNHYRLLGIEVFEENPNVIERSADRQMAHVRTFQSGRYSAESQNVLNLVSQARGCLLNADKKAAYDAELRSELQPVPPPADSAIHSSTPGPPMAASPSDSAVYAPVPVAPVPVVLPGPVAPDPMDPRATAPVPIAPVPVAPVPIAPVPIAPVPIAPAPVDAIAPSPSASEVFPTAPADGAGGGMNPASSGVNLPIRSRQSTVASESSPLKNPAVLVGGTVALALLAIGLTSMLLWRGNDQQVAEPGGGTTTQRPTTVPSSNSTPNRDVKQEARDPDSRLTDPNAPGPDSNGSNSIAPPRDFIALQFDKNAHVELENSAALANLGSSRFTAEAWVFTNPQASSRSFTYFGNFVRPDAGQEAAGWYLKTDAAGRAKAKTIVRFVHAGASQIRNVFFERSGTHLGEWEHLAVCAAPSLSGAKLSLFRNGRRVVQTQIDGPLDASPTNLFLGVAPAGFDGNFDGAVRAFRLSSSTKYTDDFTPDPVFARDPDTTILLDFSQVTRAQIVDLAGGDQNGLVRGPTWVRTSMSGSSSQFAALARTPYASGTTAAVPTAPTQYAFNALEMKGGSNVQFRDTASTADPTVGTFTAEMWVRLGSGNAQFASLMGNQAVTNRQYAGWALLGIQTPAGLQVYFASSSATGRREQSVGTPTRNAGPWYHIAVCGEPAGTGGSAVSAFVNGQPVFDRSLTAAPSPSDFFIGAGAPEAAFASKTDMVVRSFRLSSVVRYRDKFTASNVLKADESTEVLVDFSRPGVPIVDAAGQSNEGIPTGANWVRVTGDKDGERVEPLNINAADVAQTPTAPATAQLQTVPSKPDRDAALAEIKDVLSAEYEAAKTVAGKRALVSLLYDQSAKENDPTMLFVFLNEIRQFGAESGLVDTTFRVIEDMSRKFEIDGMQLKGLAFKELASSIRTPADRRQLAGIAFDLANETASEHRFDLADEFMKQAVSLARALRDQEMVKTYVARSHQITDGKQAWTRAKGAQRKLAESPDDPDANQRLGQYLCFVRDRWSDGLKHLAKASDDRLKSIATNEQESPDEPNAQVDLAEAWLAWAAEAEDDEQISGRRRAKFWYTQAMARLDDSLLKTKVERRLEELADVPAAVTTFGSKDRLAWLDGKPPGVIHVMSQATSAVIALTVSASGKYAVTGDQGNAVRIWDLEKGTQLQQVGTSYYVHAAAFTPDESAVIASAGVRGLGIWDVATGVQQGQIPTGSRISSVLVAPEGRRLLFGQSTSTRPNVGIWNFAAKNQTGLNAGSSVYCMAMTSDGRILATGHSSAVRLWDLTRGGQPLHQFTISMSVDDLDFSPDNGVLIASGQQQVIAWNLRTREQAFVIDNRGFNRSPCAFSPDGRRILTGGGSTGEIKIWDAANGKLIAALQPQNRQLGRTRYVNCARFLPDSRGAVTGCYTGEVMVWRLPD